MSARHLAPDDAPQHWELTLVSNHLSPEHPLPGQLLIHLFVFYMPHPEPC